MSIYFTGPTPKYCTSCGKELVIETIKNTYDPYTGEKIGNERLRCPTLWHDKYYKEIHTTEAKWVLETN
jgi:hypothetical protein